jgi:hypothetical protein
MAKPRASKRPAKAGHPRNAGIKKGDWWALVRGPRALPVVFNTEKDARSDRDSDEYMVRVSIAPAAPPLVDVWAVIRKPIATAIVRDFMGGESPFKLARRYGLRIRAVEDLLRSRMR